MNSLPETTSRVSGALGAVCCLLAFAAIAGAQGSDCLVSPPSVTITCPTQPLPALAMFTVGVPAVTDPTLTFTAQWSLLNNTAGASIVGLSSCGALPGGATCPVTVQVTQVGSVTVRADIIINTPAGPVPKNCQGTVTVGDNGPPVITCPPDANVQCNAPTTPPATGTATATDPCSSVTVTFTDATTGATCAGPIITRTWTATDGSGNTATCAQIITTVDTTPPLITCPGAVSVECFSQVPMPDVGLVTASDNCGGLVTVIHLSDSASNGTSSCNVITRTYQATDPCGNTNTCTQIITVNDTTPPSITCPPAATFECFSQVPLPDVGLVTTSDNCGGLVTVIHLSDSASSGTANCNVITRIYQGTDPCGNTNTCTQIITVSDTMPPAITCPQDITVPCGTSTDPTVTGFATATDNCDPNPGISHSDVQVGTCSIIPSPNPTSATITRTWTAIDSCLNVSTCVQIITLQGIPQFPCTQPAVANLGGGCGPRAPRLMMSLPMPGGFVSLHVGEASSNAQLIVAAQLPPFGALEPLAAPCMMGVDVYAPTTMVMDQFVTDPAGEWTYAFLLAGVPELVNLNVRIQAAVYSSGGPLGFLDLSDVIEGTIGNCPPCTATQELWAGIGPVAQTYALEWLNLFPAGFEVGVFNPGNGNTAPNGFFWTSDVAGRDALKMFLGNLPPPGGTNSLILMDVMNPVSSLPASPGSGSLARYTAVLKLNIAFSAAGLLGGNPIPQPGIGALTFISPGDALDGLTVLQILAIANQVLAGVIPLPAGYSLTSLAGLLEEFSVAYLACVPSGFASMHLFVAP
jgi:hypothetical protein